VSRLNADFIDDMAGLSGANPRAVRNSTVVSNDIHRLVGLLEGVRGEERENVWPEERGEEWREKKSMTYREWGVEWG